MSLSDENKLNELTEMIRGINQSVLEPGKVLLSTWRDYLSMSVRLKRDITKELFFKPRNLLESHDEAVELCGNKEIAMCAVEVTKKYPDVDEICQSIKEKFEFADKKYRIVAPDGTIRQKRTVGDRQNRDLEDAVVFLRKWQEEIQKRLTLEDYWLAKESSRLRVEEFKKLREEKAKIWHGYLQGQLLADVLERDLMEAVRSAEMGDRNLGLPGDGLVSGNFTFTLFTYMVNNSSGSKNCRPEWTTMDLSIFHFSATVW